jgi:chaperonin GroES
MSEKVKFRPLGERVLVEPLVQENKSAGGIILGGEEKVISSIAGTIVAKGKDVEELVVGDIVKYGPNSGMGTQLEGKDYVIIREKDIQGVIE